MINDALRYAAAGWAVFPLRPGGKEPIEKGGVHNATTDPDQIRRWWKQYPSANIGVACGQASGGLLVIDIDVDHNGSGIDGRETIRQWEDEHGAFPETVTATTGGDGQHLFFKIQGRQRNGAKRLPGVDWRADGGYIVAPPSTCTGHAHPYFWDLAPEDIEVAAANDSVMQLLNTKKQPDTAPDGSIPQTVPEGQRNDTIFRLASKLRGMGLSEDAIKQAMKAENDAKCSPPLPNRELWQIYNSAMKYEPRTQPYNPREVFYNEHGAFSTEGTKPKSYLTEHDLELSDMADVKEVPTYWLEFPYLPRGEICIIGGDGGVGKTTIWASIAAGLTDRKASIFSAADIPAEWIKAENPKIICLSKEDSDKKILKKKLRMAGANLHCIKHIPLEDDRMDKILFGNDFFYQLIKHHKPDLVIIDPLQAFIDSGVRMSDRNDMRKVFRDVQKLGQQCDTAFLIVMHSNKKSGVAARQRLADSADAWDIARSVLMVGHTKEPGIIYISHEKSSYAEAGDTILCAIENGRIVVKGRTNKKDRDFVQEHLTVQRATPARDEAKQLILEFLADGEKPVNELDEYLIACGISKKTVSSAKAELRASQILKERRTSDGYGKGVKIWYSVNVP